MDSGYWQAGAARVLRRTAGTAAVIGLTAAAVATGAGTASAAAVGCSQSGPLVMCGVLGFSGEHKVVVPAGITKIRVSAVGGSGTTNGAQGGRGGIVEADIDVKPGDTLYLRAGEDGVDGAGGASTVATKSIDDRAEGMASRIVVAPGGGGASPGGAGGDAGSDGSGTNAGKAGTRDAGGAGGGGGAAGTLAVGGKGVGSGGSGGAGVYGGGGGASGGGGGGGAYLVPKGGSSKLADWGRTPGVSLTYSYSIGGLLGQFGSSDLGNLLDSGSAGSSAGSTGS